MTRDPRMKERKKYGLKAARRAPQFSKRLTLSKVVKNPGTTAVFRGFSFSKGLTQFDTTKPLLTRFLWVKWWTTTQKEGLWVKK